MGLWAAAEALARCEWLLSALVVAAAFKAWYKTTQGVCASARRLDGRTALVTGANTAEVRACACEGATVALLALDLASLASVRACAREVLASEPRLDILVNNAGAAGLGDGKSVDGLHLGLQTNHFGPWLLTVLLLPLLRASAPARVLFVASSAHRFATLAPEQLDWERARRLHPLRLYCLSKLANVVAANELARRLRGSGVTVNSLHPGVVHTGFLRRLPCWLAMPVNAFIRLFFKNAAEGAQTTIHLAVSEEVEGVTGRYFSDCTESWVRTEATDEALGRAVWEKCEQLVGLRDSERPRFDS